MAKTLVLISDMDETGLNIASSNTDDEIAVCLLQNAVYLSTKGKKLCDALISQDKKIYAVEKDVNLRGLKDQIYPEVKLVSYGDVIDLVLAHKNIINF